MTPGFSAKLMKKTLATAAAALLTLTFAGTLQPAGQSDNRFAANPITATAALAAVTPPADPGPMPDKEFSLQMDWAEVQARYAYDKNTPLNITVDGQKDFTAFTKYHLFYDSLNGDRVPAVLMMPKPHIKPYKSERSTVAGSYPVVFFMHFHVSDKSLADLCQQWVGQGIAVFAIDGVFKGERAEEGKDILMPNPADSGKHMEMQIKDILRGFDVVAGWKGLDPGRIGYFGISMGALTGTAATALDTRIKSIVICDGGGDLRLLFEFSDYGDVTKIKKYMTDNNLTPSQVMDALKYVDPSVFAPHLGNRPILLENGVRDTTISIPSMLKLHRLITTPDKKIIWYDSDHIVPFDRVIYDTLAWFKKTL